MSEFGPDLIIENQDVPDSLRHNKKNLPLGRYLKKKLRQRLGFPEDGTPKEKLQEVKEEMSELLQIALLDPENRSKTFRKILTDQNKQKVLNLETKQHIYSRKGVL